MPVDLVFTLVLLLPDLGRGLHPIQAGAGHRVSAALSGTSRCAGTSSTFHLNKIVCSTACSDTLTYVMAGYAIRAVPASTSFQILPA